MLEPLIVLTVLNCIFMFSSTMTTCALWWQYRSHRCYFKKSSMQEMSKYDLKKSKSSCTCKKSKRTRKSKTENITNAMDKKSASFLNREEKNRKDERGKGRIKFKYLSQFKKPSEEKGFSIERLREQDFRERSKMSEASQSGNESKAAVVMEYSTVQKIVQILDNDSEITATKLAVKDFNKHIVEDKERRVSCDDQCKLDHECA